jgi:hypothetical protein
VLYTTCTRSKAPERPCLLALQPRHLAASRIRGCTSQQRRARRWAAWDLVGVRVLSVTHSVIRCPRCGPLRPTALAVFTALPPGPFRPCPGPLPPGHRLVAVGRDACTADLRLDRAGVAVNPRTGKIPAVEERTNVPWIYAVGDVLENRQVGSGVVG